MAFTAGAFPMLLAGAVMLLVAAGLLKVGLHRRAVRVFALLLVLRAGINLANAVVFITEDPTAWRIYPLFLLPLPVVALYFVAVYPARRSWLPAGIGGAALFAAPALLLEAVYAARPALYWDLSGVQAAPAELFLDFTIPLGPLYAFFSITSVAFAAVALVLARDALEAKTSSSRRSMLLVSLGFGLLVVDVAGRGFLIGNLAGGTVTEVVMGASFLLVGLTWLWLLVVAFGHRDPAVQDDLMRYVLVLPLPLLTAVALGLAPAGSSFGAGLGIFFSGLWRLALPLMVTYALLRLQMFELDVKVRTTVQRSAVAAVFLVVFFAASETAEIFVSETVGPFVGILAAAAIAFAFRPLERFAERIAKAAVPHARSVAEMDADERREVYREQLRIALADGRLTDKQRVMLDAARERLGLSDDEVEAIEGEVRGEAGAGARRGRTPAADEPA